MKACKFFISSLMLMLFSLTSCETDDLKEDINTLKNRVQNLEALVQQVNDNVKAVQVFFEQNKTIKSWTENSGTYTLTMSDGSTIVLTQGSKGEVKMPEFSIDDEGYWVINGERVRKAVGDNGQTPEFRISTDGFWEIRFGETDTFKQVLDENGLPVKAAVDGDAEGGEGIFEDVQIKDDMLVVTINGVEYSLPIVADLVAEIAKPKNGAGEFENGVWYIKWGTTVQTEVTVDGDNYFVTVPAGGWTASVSEPDENGKAILSVTAPAVSTRATADNGTELVLQVNKGIHWAIDKIAVKAADVMNTMLDRYNAGRDLVIGNVIVNKEKFGEAKHITQDLTIDKTTENPGGVYFVDGGKTLTITSDWEYGFNHLIVIGNDGEKTAAFKFVNKTGRMVYLNSSKTEEKTGYFLWQNVTYENDDNSFYFNWNATTFKPFDFVMDNCNIKLTGRSLMTFWNTENRQFNELKIQNCIFKGEKDIVGGSDGYSENFGPITFVNNIFYAPTNTAYKLIDGNNLSVDKITVSNNTFVNVEPGANTAYIQVKKVNTHFTCTKNIFYYSGAMNGGNRVIFYPQNYDNEDFNGSLEGSLKQNIAYKGSGTSEWGTVWYGKQPVVDYEKVRELTGEANSPFEILDLTNGIFIPKAEYADYGAHIN